MPDNDLYDREEVDILIRFRDVSDIDALKIDIELMLESLCADGTIIED